MALPEILVFYEPQQIVSKAVTSTTGADEVIFWEPSPMTAVDFYTQGEILEIVSAGPPSVIVTPAEIGMYKSAPALAADTWTPITHGLNNDTPDVTAVETVGGAAVLIDWRVSATNPNNVIEVYSDQAYSAGQLRISVLGGINFAGGGGTSSVPIGVHPSLAGLEIYFGPSPLPDPATMPNTVYFVIPTT
jgi:hypothetical protein